MQIIAKNSANKVHVVFIKLNSLVIWIIDQNWTNKVFVFFFIKGNSLVMSIIAQNSVNKVSFF